MSYVRVIPRDLFNEASLLKCYGRLAILLGDTPDHQAQLSEGDGGPFEVWQDDADGSITIASLPFKVAGQRVRLHRPLNSREPWPLYATTEDFEEVAVFDDQGNFTPAMLAFIRGEADGRG